MYYSVADRRRLYRTGAALPRQADYALTACLAFVTGAAMLATVFLATRGVAGFSFALVLGDENGFLQNLQALSYFTSVFVCLYGLATGNKRLFAAICLVLTVLLLGEETGWGRRIFSPGSPAIDDSSWRALRYLFPGAVIFYFFAVPGLARLKTLAPGARALGYTAPGFRFQFYFAQLLLATWIAVLATPAPEMQNALIEVRETYFAGAIALHLMLNFIAHAAPPRRAAQSSNGSFISTVSSRSGDVDNSATGHSISSSI